MANANVPVRLRGRGGIVVILKHGIEERETATLQEPHASLHIPNTLQLDDVQFRQLVEVSSVGVVVGDKLGHIVYMNQALRRLLGYDDDQFDLPQSWTSLTPPEHAVRDAQAVAEIQATGACSPYEKEYLTRDGRRVPVLVGAAVIDWAPDDSRVVAAFVTDLTAQKQAEQAQRAREAEFQTLFDLLPVGIAVARDATCSRVDVNSALAELWGTVPGSNASLSEPSATPKRRVFSDGRELRPQDLPLQRAASEGRPLDDIEAEVLRPDGSRIHVLGSAVPLRDEHGMVRGSIGAFVDITERKRAEAERAALLARAEAERAVAQRAAERTSILHGVMASLAGAVTTEQIAQILIEQSCQALAANAGSVALLSQDRSEFVVVATLGYPEHMTQRYKSFPATLVSPMTVATQTLDMCVVETHEAWEIQYPNLQDVGEHSHAAVAVPLMLGSQAMGVFGLSFAAPRAVDEDDRKLLLTLGRQCALAFERARLYEAERSARLAAEAAVGVRDHFLSIAAHELKTPLTSIQGNAQLILRRVAAQSSLDERNMRGLQVVVEQSQRLGAMISSLLDVSRIQSGQLELNLKPLDMCALARRIIEDATPTLNHHIFNCMLPEHAIMIEGDELRLEEVVQNLLSNAVKYSPDGGTITVTVSQTDSSVDVVVADQGIGIPTEAQPHVFQRFFRAPNVDSINISGMGIGLYLVREIVELHGGVIQVESVEGEGSRFIVRLPAVGSNRSTPR